VVQGTRELMVPMAAAEECTRALPQDLLLRLTGAGHVPWWEHADAIFSALDALLSGQPVTGAVRP
jgi:pimeloyl-ACP methyl ester carboxylesterase